MGKDEIERDIDLDHLTVVIQQGGASEEYVIIKDSETGEIQVCTVDEYFEYYDLMGFEKNAWREM